MMHNSTNVPRAPKVCLSHGKVRKRCGDQSAQSTTNPTTIETSAPRLRVSTAAVAHRPLPNQKIPRPRRTASPAAIIAPTERNSAADSG